MKKGKQRRHKVHLYTVVASVSGKLALRSYQDLLQRLWLRLLHVPGLGYRIATVLSRGQRDALCGTGSTLYTVHFGSPTGRKPLLPMEGDAFRDASVLGNSLTSSLCLASPVRERFRLEQFLLLRVLLEWLSESEGGMHRRAKWLILKHGCKDANLQAAGLLIILLRNPTGPSWKLFFFSRSKTKSRVTLQWL